MNLQAPQPHLTDLTQTCCPSARHPAGLRHGPCGADETDADVTACCQAVLFQIQPSTTRRPLAIVKIRGRARQSCLRFPETGLRFAFNRRSRPTRPLFSTTPMVTVQMIDTGSSPPRPSQVVPRTSWQYK